MRFSLRALGFVSTIIASVCLLVARYWMIDGFSVATTVGICVLLLGTLVAAVWVRWRKSNLLNRLAGILIVLLCLFAFSMMLVSIESNSGIKNNRIAYRLERIISSRSGNSSIKFQFPRMKMKYVYVEGVVESDKEFTQLQTEVMKQRWEALDGVIWNVAVLKTGESYSETVHTSFEDSRR